MNCFRTPCINVNIRILPRKIDEQYSDRIPVGNVGNISE